MLFHHKSPLDLEARASRLEIIKTNDEANITTLGYKQEMKRELSLFSQFAISFSVLGLLPSIGACFNYQVIGVSPVAWIVFAILVLLVAMSMAEVCSAYPVATGSPYAVLKLSPPKYKVILTWITAWLQWMCQITAAPSVNYSGASMILALKLYTSPGYSPSNGEVFGLSVGICVSHAILALVPTKLMGRINSFGTIMNIIALIIVFVLIFACNDRTSMNEGITKYNNDLRAWGLINTTDWPMGVAFIQSSLSILWTMLGYDSPWHMLEEVSNASVASPRAIVLTALSGGIIGGIFMIAIAYTCVDFEEIMADPQGLGQPFITYFTQFMKRDVVLAALALTIISLYFMGAACAVSSSRATYAYSRDDMLPGSRWWKLVNSRTETPINAVWANLLVQILLLVLIFGGSVVIGAIFSVGGIAGFISFTMPVLLKLTYARKTFQPGPWNLGVFSVPIGMVSVGYVAMMIPFLCFPTVKGADLTPQDMNWTVVVYFGTLVLSLCCYFGFAHKWYHGPKSNLDSEESEEYETNDSAGDKEITRVEQESKSSDSDGYN